jgi:hypothetical protein
VSTEFYTLEGAVAEVERLRRFEKQAWRLVEEVATLQAALIELDNLYPNNPIIEKALTATEKADG